MSIKASRTGTARATAAKGSPRRSATIGPALTGSAGASAPARRPGRSSKAEWEAQLAELGEAFRRVFRSVRRLRGRDTHLLGSEVSHAQFELLIELYDRGPLPAGELAQAAQLTPATVTQMLDHLAACGHVERARSESDRRVVVSRLTSEGRSKVQDKRAVWRGRWQQVLADMEAEELQAATRVLERLSAVFDDPPQADQV